MADRDEIAAKANAAYNEISGGSNLKDLIKAVRTAQGAKGRQLSKKELKAKAALAKAESAVAAEQAAQAATLAALAKEADLVKAQAEEQARSARAAETRTRREAAVADARARRAAQSQKVKSLKRTIDLAIGAALKSVTAQQINDIIRLQASLKSAWSALPAAMQYAEDREKLVENDGIIEDLREIYKHQQESTAAQVKAAQVAVTEAAATAPEAVEQPQATTPSSESTRSRLSGLGKSAWNLTKGAGRWIKNDVQGSVGLMSGLVRAGAFGIGQAARSTAKVTGSVAKAPFTAIKAVTAGIAKVADRLKEVKEKTVDWFDKKFGSFFRRLWGVIRSPFAAAKAGASFLGKAVGWAALLTSVFVPIVQGLYEELSKTFSMDYVSKKFEEFKDWAFEKISGFFSYLKDAPGKVVDKVKEWGTDIKDGAYGLGSKVGNYAVSGIQAAASTVGADDRNSGNQTSTPDDRQLKKLQDTYGAYKGSKTSISRSLYAMDIRSQLAAINPNAIPATMAQNLAADGFKPKVQVAPAVRGTTTAEPAQGQGRVVSSGGAPADSGTAKPVTATPSTKSFSEMSGSSSPASSGSSSGAGVVQVPRSMADDSLFALNTGVLSQ